ncbi:MAG: hypothetical protein NXH85_10475 [Pseudomonadaceae bacterium]|nr:hypothetical protein [Pseudomonadaceae bacterium]
MSRFKAFAIHFAISLAIFVFLAYLVLAHWYPDFFFDSDGGWQGIRIIVLVDLVLGPLLTLVVYKAGKPGLKFDLSMIALVQSVCLIAGVWVVYNERPIALVYTDGYFYSNSAGSYRDADLAVPDLSSFPGQTPKRLMTALPADPNEQRLIRRNSLQSERPLRLRVEYYEPFNWQNASEHDQPLTIDRVLERDPDGNEITRWLIENGGSLEDYAYFPYAGRYGLKIVAVNRHSGRITGVLPMALYGPDGPTPQDNPNMKSDQSTAEASETTSAD